MQIFYGLWWIRITNHGGSVARGGADALTWIGLDSAGDLRVGCCLDDDHTSLRVERAGFSIFSTVGDRGFPDRNNASFLLNPHDASILKAVDAS